MTDDRSGRLTLWYFRFGAFMTVALIVGTLVYKLLGFASVKVLEEEVAPPPFTLTAELFAPFEGAAAPPEEQVVRTTSPHAGVLDRPLRIAGPRRASLAPALALAGAENEAARVEWVRIDDRVERYEALQRGEVDLIWESLPGLAEALHRMHLLPLPARVVALVGQSRGTDALVGRAVVAGASPLVGQAAALEAFSPAHFLYLHRLVQTGMADEVKAKHLAGLVLTGSPNAAVQSWNAGQVRILGGSEPALPDAYDREGPPLFRMDTSGGPEQIDEILLAGPQVLASAPGSVAAAIAAWMDVSDRFSKEPPGALELLLTKMGVEEEEAERMLEGVAFARHSNAQAFFEGEGAVRLQAAQVIWQREGSVRQTLPASDWIDGRFQPISQDAAARAP